MRGWCCCAYLTERRSRLLSLIIFTRLNPTWCHHSTKLKIQLSVNAHIENVAPAGCKKICSTPITPPFLLLDLLVHLLWKYKNKKKRKREMYYCCILFCSWHILKWTAMVDMVSHTVQNQHESIPLLFEAPNSRPSVLNVGQWTLCNSS